MQKSKLKERHTFNLDHMEIEHPKAEYKSLDSGTTKEHFCFLFRPGQEGVEHQRYFCGARCDNCKKGEFWNCTWEDAGANERVHDVFVSTAEIQAKRYLNKTLFSICLVTPSSKFS